MLDVSIGIVFIFVLVSTVCSAIREGLESKLKTRAAYLEKGIRELLHDRDGIGVARSLFNHPLIYSLYSGQYQGPSRKSGASDSSSRPKIFARGGGLPSYIPARNFAIALLDIAAKGPITDEVSSDPAAPALSLESVRASMLSLKNPPVQRALLIAIDTAHGDLDRARANIEAWYDSSMDRVSGWYKRSTQWIIFGIGLVLAVGLNIDTLAIADYLYRHDAAREAIVAVAAEAANRGSAGEIAYQEAATQLQSLSLPIGWSGTWQRTPGPDTWYAPIWMVAGPILGWLITAFAAMLGAPFWFDLLNKIMVIRSTVKPHEKSPEESSEDRQMRTTTVRAAPASRAPVAPQLVTSPITPPGTAPGTMPGTMQRPAVPAFVQVEGSDAEGCSAEEDAKLPGQGNTTADDELPAARGGVA